MFSGRRSARSGGAVLGAGPVSGATGDGLIGSAIAKTRSSISGNIPVLPEQMSAKHAPTDRLGSCSHGSASRVASHRDAATNRTEQVSAWRFAEPMLNPSGEVALTGVAGRGSCFGFAYSRADLES